MFKWKIKFCILILFLININCQLKQENNDEIEPKKVQIKYLHYKNWNKFLFKSINDEKDLLVNFHSIACDIQIFSINETNIIKKINNKNKNNIFSLLIQKEKIKNTLLYIKPIINSGNNGKNYEFRTCPLIINSVYKNEYKLDIEKEKYMSFSFTKNLPYIILSYKIENINDGFTTLSFIPDVNYIFDVKINNEINKIISNSSNIFLENSKLSKNTLTINITLNEKNNLEENYESVLIFRLIESNSTSIIEKNCLHLGFTTSKRDYQYYYLEVFKGEEGEIMIHNKRLYGELYGVIKPKLGINPYNREVYTKKDDEDNHLQFDALTLKLSFKSYQTEQCENGCYLLLNYSHDDYNSNNKNSIVGFEYSLLVRIWDEEETGSQIINIPFNEYIFGAFEKESINHHYYSLDIPKDTEEIIIQFEGNYIDGYIGNGKRKLNTFRNLNNSQILNLSENKVVIEYNKSQLNKLNVTDSISFAFRSKNYFSTIFSFYYFRILILKKDEKYILYPLDSSIGNFCSPKKDESDTFACYCFLKNDYNKFSLNYSISTSNKKDRLTYNYLKLIDGKIIGNNSDKYISQTIYDNKASMVKFIFENEKIASILSTLPNNNKEIYPQIYSKQLYHLSNKNNIFIFDLKRNYSLTLNYLQGQGEIKYSGNSLYANENFKGKPFCFNISESMKNISFIYDNELTFYTKIEEINNLKEITQDEALRQLIEAKNLPIYYYIKNGENEINEMNIHYRIKIIKNINRDKRILFKIDGCILDENKFNQIRNLDGEFIDLDNLFKGTYEISFKIGILNINKTIKRGDYILIRIDSNFEFTTEKLLLELLSMSKKDLNYILPVNNFIADTYSSPGKNYSIIIDEEEKSGKCILVEFIPDCSNMTIKLQKKQNITKMEMKKISNENEILQKYRIQNFNDDFILRVEAPQDISYGNYILRYYFTKIDNEKYYKLNEKFTKKKGYSKNDIILEFKELELIYNKNKSIITKKEDEKDDNSFYIYSFLYLKENDLKKESINSSFYQKNVIKSVTYIDKNSKFSLYFKDLNNLLDNINLNNFNFVFNLHIKIFVYKKNMFNEEFYLYTIPINLEDELKDTNSKLIWILIIASLGLVIIVIIIISVIIVTRMKKSNKNLKEKVLAISFTSGKIDDEIIGKASNSKNDEDYENTFI